MDISDTIAPDSDQLDAVDLAAGPRTFTIERVSKGNAEQPVNIHLAEFPRPWRPGKSMRRVLVACWGADASAYVGRRVRLFCDPEVRFGGAAVGGTRIAALSHIDKRKAVPLLVSRGKSAMFTVEPLPDATPTGPSLADRITTALTKFAEVDVSLAQLEAERGKPSTDWNEQDVTELGAVFQSIQRGDVKVADVFPVDADDPQQDVPEPEGWAEQ